MIAIPQAEACGICFNGLFHLRRLMHLGLCCIFPGKNMLIAGRRILGCLHVHPCKREAGWVFRSYRHSPRIGIAWERMKTDLPQDGFDRSENSCIFCFACRTPVRRRSPVKGIVCFFCCAICFANRQMVSEPSACRRLHRNTFAFRRIGSALANLGWRGRYPAFFPSL